MQVFFFINSSAERLICDYKFLTLKLVKKKQPYQLCLKLGFFLIIRVFLCFCINPREILINQSNIMKQENRFHTLSWSRDGFTSPIGITKLKYLFSTFYANLYLPLLRLTIIFWIIVVIMIAYEEWKQHLKKLIDGGLF